MKLCLGDTPIKALFTHTDTDDGTIVPSDMQAGTIGYARGQKIVGTGKAFSFAMYGQITTNDPWPVPEVINVIEIASLQYPIKASVGFSEMASLDFSTEKTVGLITIDGTDYPITAKVVSNILTIACSQTIDLQVFYGKDEYV